MTSIIPSSTDDLTKGSDVAQSIDNNSYQKLKLSIINYLSNKKVFGRKCYACADEKYRLNITLITEHPWSNLFGYNMFLRPKKEELNNFKHNWIILCAPNFKEKNPKSHGLNK